MRQESTATDQAGKLLLIPCRTSAASCGALDWRFGTHVAGYTCGRRLLCCGNAN